MSASRSRLFQLVALLALLALPLTYAAAPRSVLVEQAPARSGDGEGSGPARLRYRPAALPLPLNLQPQAAITVLDTCMDGTLAHDEVGGAAGVVLANLQVQLWDHDTTTEDDLLDADLTAASGAFLLCSPTQDLDDTAGDGLDLYVKVVAENGFWRVQKQGPFQVDLYRVFNMAPGTTHHYGLTKPAAGLPEAGAWQIFNAVDRLWSWTGAQDPNSCWDAKDFLQPNDFSRCRQLVVEWVPDSVAGGFYDSANNRVHLNGVDFKWRDAVVREAAKAVLDDLFEDDYPDTMRCGDRTTIGKSTTAGCAWVEGFADWVATRVFNDAVLDWQVGSQIFHVNLETTDWDTAGWDYGDAVEGRVAGALLDLADATNDVPWDRVAEGPSQIWATLLKAAWDPYRRHRIFAEFWWNRTNDGYNGQPNQAAWDNTLASLYQNTIDYGLRDPLTNGSVTSRRVPQPPQNFRFTTTTSYWSVMAIRPPLSASPVADYDLKIFGTESMSGNPVGASTSGGAVADFVAIDSNSAKQPLGTYYPQAYRFSGSAGTGPYDLRFVQAQTNVGIGQSANVSMAVSNPVAIWETSVLANAAVKVEVTQAAGQDAELFLFCSTNVASTWIRGRSAATAAAPAQPSGVETLVWTAPASAPGFCAIVLINKSGSGIYTVTRKS